MRVLGISAYYHDAAVALVDDGRVEYAAQEERFTRVKHDPSFPQEAIRSCLETTGVRAAEIDLVAFYDKPFLKFERLLETYLAFAPRGFASFRQALPLWLKEKLFQRSLLVKELKTVADDVDWQRKLLFSEHHLSHAASAFFPSPFERAAVLTMDGVGEWTTTSLALGEGSRLKVDPRDPLSALARTTLLRLHLLHGLQGQFGRIQGDGARALRRTEVSRPHQADSSSTSRRMAASG